MIEQLISYGQVTKDFKEIARLKKYLQKIKNGEIEPHRLDCYKIDIMVEFSYIFKFLMVGGNAWLAKDVEVFYPSDKYPPHTDNNGTSYFIGLESGQFFIDGVTYDIVPFVLYSFNDRVPHNTNFPAIMLS